MKVFATTKLFKNCSFNDATYRHHKMDLAGLDIVALVKPGLWQMDNRAIRTVIEEQWARLLKQRRKAI